MQHEDGLLAQHQFILAVIAHEDLTRLDHKVAAEILKRYYPKHGNARASLRFIEQGTRSDRKNVIISRDRLLAAGAFTLLREGKGTRPAEYLPNWAFPASGGAGTTASSNDHSGGVGTTSGGGVQTTANVSSGGAGTTESYLHKPVYKTGILIDRIEPAAPTAPRPVGADAPPGRETAGEKKQRGGFAELWAAYAYARGKAEAKRAYEKLAPDAEQHTAMVTAAVAWREVWAAQNKPDAPRFTLAKWIEREEYDCDPPAAYQPKARKADKPARVAGGKQLSEPMRVLAAEGFGDPFNDWRVRLTLAGPGGQQEHLLHIIGRDGAAEGAETLKLLQDVIDTPMARWPGEHIRLETAAGRIVGAVREPASDRIVQIDRSDVSEKDGEMVMRIWLTDGDDMPEGSIEFALKSKIAWMQEKGRKQFEALCRAIGATGIDDTEELHFLPFLLKADGTFEPAPELRAAA